MRRFPACAYLILLVACSGSSEDYFRDLDPESGPPAELVVRNETRQRKEWGRQMKALLHAGQYDSLDAIARELRQHRTRWPNGNWKLRTFYGFGFEEPAVASSESQWKTLLDELRGWSKARPNSATARVALGTALLGYAWHARGSGWAREVSDDGYRLFHRRLGEADSVLRTSRHLAERCPGMEATLLRVALGQGWKRPVYDSLFNAAIQAEPTYDAYYELKAYRLLPRWFGRPGEWERYADQVANHIGGPEGDAVYARLVWYLTEFHRNIFKETDASWERTSRGYRHLLRRYPHSLELQSQYGLLAVYAESPAQARLMFERIGSRVDPEIWSRDYFVSAREWATQ